MSLLDRLLSRVGLARSTPPAPPAEARPILERLQALEAMVEGLQDSVDRQARRHDERLNELTRRLEPTELARSLSEDARRRGL